MDDARRLARREPRPYLVIGLDNDPELVSFVWETAGKIPGDAELTDIV